MQSRSSSVSSSSVPLAYRSQSPLPSPINNRHNCMTAAAKRYRFLRRLFKFRQMDFQFASWQMIYLFISPQKVFRNFQYRKQTKAQFARDDPAFVVLLCIWLCITSIGFGLVLRLRFAEFILFLLYSVFVDTIFAGIIVATLLWFLSNRYLRKPSCRDEDVEWGYAFDVHLNAYFPALIILHFFQLFFYSWFLSSPSFLSRLFANTLWVVAIGYYIFITFLGYSALPILQKTRYIMFTLPLLGLFFIISMILHWNPCEAMVLFYVNRIV